MMLNRPQRSRASVRIFQASASVIVALCASSALAIPKNSELMPLIGGLKVGNIRANPNVFAYPLQTTLPIAGFQPLVVTTLTDEWFEEDDFNWYTHTSSTPAGNTLPNNSNPRYTFLSTLDSGGQTHIMSAEVAAQINLEAAGRAGSNVILATGAAGTEELTVSDPIGLYTSGFQNVTGAGLSVNPNAWRGHYGVSIATASDE
ncbi:MAG TPA: hypothetical protein PK402_14355, partial [Tepidisphaeraceae bacterium]|nr:hypothetical protein [Tepidisphaeraceae bacterium]